MLEADWGERLGELVTLMEGLEAALLEARPDAGVEGLMAAKSGAELGKVQSFSDLTVERPLPGWERRGTGERSCAAMR